MAYILLGPVSRFMSHTRFLFTLRSTTRPSDYHSLLLFRLAGLSLEAPSIPSAHLLSVKSGDPPSPPKLSSEPSANLLAPHAQPKLSSYGQFFVMESTCPHLGAELSHAEIEDCGPDSVVAVCPWHRYDFDLKTGKSETGLRACTYEVDIRPSPATTKKGEDASSDVWVEIPPNGPWEVVEIRPVSEDFADPPPESTIWNSVTAKVAQMDLEEQPTPTTLMEWAVLILNTPNPDLKVERTRQAISAFRNGKLKSIGRSLQNTPTPPDIPPRPVDLQVVAPGKVTKRGKAGNIKSRIAILHALANIEQWAIDLSWDVIARFGNVKIEGKPLPQQFFADWAKVAEDEAKHFSLLRRRLEELGSFYGEHTVHAGLWESAQETAHSLPARLSIIHLVHEARGLDVNPTTIAKFRAANDPESVKVLEIIHHDEITHVTAGHRWFSWVCEQTGDDPVHTFREHVRRHFAGAIKGPYNAEDRRKAGMTPAFYEDLTGELGQAPPVKIPPSEVPMTPVVATVPVGYEV